MAKLFRRRFICLAGLTVAAAALQSLAAQAAGVPGNRLVPADAGQHRKRPASRYRFFTGDDAVFIEAAVERLIPSDMHGPGARHVGVALFIDRQLGSTWGAGDAFRRSQSWQARQPVDTTRVPPGMTPAGLFRAALRGIEADLALSPQSGPTVLVAHKPVSARRRFAQLPATDQAIYLKTLQAGEKDLDGIPSQVFFECLLSLTIEGFFGDPVHGGNEEGLAGVGSDGAVASVTVPACAH